VSVADGDVFRVSGRVTVRVIGDEAFIMDLDGLRTYSLNETAAFIWSRIDGVRSAADIADAALERFDITPSECRKSVRETLDSLLAEHLVVPAGSP
jgi:hypothetical protein